MYLRKSRADQEAELRGEGETLSRHEAILLSLAQKLDIRISNIYKEIVSGETIFSRPQVQSMLSNVEQGVYAGVLVIEVERLARGDTIDQGIISQAFKYSNTMIITPIKIYNPSDEFDEEYFEFGLFMSRREYKTINRRIQRGRIASIKDGKYISSIPPYGYERVKLTNACGYTLKPHETESFAVRLIFDLYVHGVTNEFGIHEAFGSQKIAAYLDNLGIKPRRSKNWSSPSIRTILKNPVYTGKICWGKRKEEKRIVQGKIVISRPNSSEYMINEGLHESLISNETFELAKKIMKANSKTPLKKSNSLQNPLSGLIYCEKCGKLMNRLSPNKKNRYASIRCQNPSCDNISAPIYVIEEIVLQSLADWLKDYEFELDFKESLTTLDEDTYLSASIQSLENEIVHQKKQQAKLYEFLEKEIYTPELFLERNHAIGEELRLAYAKLEELKQRYNCHSIYTLSPQLLSPIITTVIKSYRSCSNATEKNNLLKEVLAKITYIKTSKNNKAQIDKANFKIELFPKLPQSFHQCDFVTDKIKTNRYNNSR
ncbi:MAG: recombinase family protein [Velocimicrobium sp.]